MTTVDTRVQTFGPVDQRSLEQLLRCAEAGDAAAAVLCADHHPGYSQPIGGAIAYRDHISPSGVGYDIGCGNKAARTDLHADDVDIPAVMDEIVRRISFGIGRVNNEPVDHPVLDQIAHAGVEQQRRLFDLARRQLGTVGAGNHYVDLFADGDEALWVGVHFGSRGFGRKTASGFLAMAQGKAFEDHAAEGEMDSPPVLLPTDGELGQAYIEAMGLAGDYAYAGRDVVVDKVLEVLGARALEDVHNHHNFAWRETHGGGEYWVVRKGCTPAWPAQRSFVGGSMGDVSVILEGIESPESSAALYSTVHGAGRVMSRTQAAGKMGSIAVCSERDCGYRLSWAQYQHERRARGLDQHERLTLCDRHPGGRMIKRRARVKQGRVDFDQVQFELRRRGIHLRGGAADEAPEVYKRLPEVLDAHAGTIRVRHVLRPVGVAMAAPDVLDPYKD